MADESGKENEVNVQDLSFWDMLHTQYRKLMEQFSDHGDDMQLKLCRAFFEYICEGKENEAIREYREEFERFYIYDTIPEEQFLDLCDRFDAVMTDDADSWFDLDPGYCALTAYIQELQIITHRRPWHKHKWQFLRVTSKRERYKYFDACDNAYRMDVDTHEVMILKKMDNGNVEVQKPTDYEASIFSRHYYDCSVIEEEVAYALAVCPVLSYDDKGFGVYPAARQF